MMKTEDIEQYVTLNQLPSDRVGIDVIAHGLYQIGTALTPSAGSDLRKIIFPSAHGLKVGDILRFTTNQTEAPVLGIIDSVTITLACELDFDPTTDTVTRWRYTTPSYSKDGALSVSGGAVQYNKDGSTVTVTRDHTVLANNNAMPVEVLDASGNSPLAQIATDISSIEAQQTDGSQKTKITDGAGVVNTKQIGTAIISTDVGLVTQGVIHGLSTAGGGTYVDVKVAPSGALQVEATSNGANLATETTLSALNTKVTTSANGINVDVKSSVLPTGAATEATLSAMNSKLSTGQQAASASQSVTLSNEDVQDLYVVGQSAQTATINNILTATAGANATDATGYRSACVQVVSTGTAGAFIFEGSNDNVNFQAIPVWNQSVLTGTPIVAAITATASQIGYIFPVTFRYIRLRISTTITGGSVQAFTKLSQTSFAPPVQQVAQATAANFNATIAAIPAGTNVIGNVGVGVVSNADQVSAAGTIGTTNGAAKTITNGASVSFIVNITAATLTSYDFKIQESVDGTNWIDVWQSERKTGVSTIVTPALRIRGTQYRYVEVAAGTSFTRTITSARMPHAGELIRNIVDRAIAPITTSSVTPSLYAEGASFVTLTVAQGAGGSAVQFAIDGSMDGTNWVQGLKTVTGVVSGYAQGSVSNSYKYFRARVVAGIASTTINYVALEAKETPIDTTMNSGSSSSGTVALTTTASTITPPVGAIGFILQCDSAAANPMRWRAGATATVSSGFTLSPGQDSGYIPYAPQSLSLISTTGASAYVIEWILK